MKMEREKNKKHKFSFGVVFACLFCLAPVVSSFWDSLSHQTRPEKKDIAILSGGDVCDVYFFSPKSSPDDKNFLLRFSVF